MRNGYPLAHDASSERLAATQQLAVDLADLLQNLSGSLIVGEKLGNLLESLLRHVIHLWTQAWKTHGKIVLGSMPRTIGTFASRLAAALVSFDKRTAQDRSKRRQLSNKRTATLPKYGNGLCLYLHRTTCKTGLIVRSARRCRSMFFTSSVQKFQMSNQLDEALGIEVSGTADETVVGGRIGPVRPLTGNTYAAKFGLSKDQGIDAGNTTLLEYLESPASKGMERMSYLRPSQMRTVVRCSSH